jgi:hypothetical protein
LIHGGILVVAGLYRLRHIVDIMMKSRLQSLDGGITQLFQCAKLGAEGVATYLRYGCGDGLSLLIFRTCAPDLTAGKPKRSIRPRSGSAPESPETGDMA